jgi:hypothetical protein
MLHGKAPNDAQLENALVKNYTEGKTIKELWVINSAQVLIFQFFSNSKKNEKYTNTGSKDTRSGFGAGMTE